MRFECEKNSLEQELNYAKQINSSRGSYEIYSHIFLKLEENLLTLKATDSNYSFETHLSVLGYENGEVAIAGNKLLSLLQARSQKNVSFYLKGNLLEIRTEKTSAKENVSYLKKSSTKELVFPSTQIEKNPCLKIPQKKLQYLISQSSYAVSTDENRTMLTGVCLEVKNKILNFISTDGNRLALASIEICECVDTIHILPVKGLNFIKSLLTGEGDVSISLNSRRAFFHFDRYDFSMGLIAGNFPAYASIIPKNQKYKIEVSKEELFESIRMAAIISKRIFFEFKENNLIISSERSEDGFTESEIALSSYVSENIKFALNSDYLISSLRVIEGNSILLSFKDEKTVVLLEALEVTGISPMHLIMPMSLN